MRTRLLSLTLSAFAMAGVAQAQDYVVSQLESQGQMHYLRAPKEITIQKGYSTTFVTSVLNPVDVYQGWQQSIRFTTDEEGNNFTTDITTAKVSDQQIVSEVLYTDNGYNGYFAGGWYLKTDEDHNENVVIILVADLNGRWVVPNSDFTPLYSIGISAENAEVGTYYIHFMNNKYSGRNDTEKQDKDQDGNLLWEDAEHTIPMKAVRSTNYPTYTVKVNVVDKLTVTLNDTDTELPSASETEVDVVLNRSIKKDAWNTIVLPFDMTATQIADAFGANAKVAEFEDIEYGYDENDENVVNIDVKFTTANSITANVPCMIYPDIAENLTSVTISDVLIQEPEEDPMTESTTTEGVGKRKYPIGEFHGIYTPTTLEASSDDGGYFFISNNKFYRSTGETTMKGYRAYLYSVYDLYQGAEIKANIKIDGQDATAIEGIGVAKKTVNGDIYAVDGQLVRRGGDTDNLPKGIYIVNGKKVYVK